MIDHLHGDLSWLTFLTRRRIKGVTLRRGVSFRLARHCRIAVGIACAHSPPSTKAWTLRLARYRRFRRA